MSLDYGPKTPTQKGHVKTHTCVGLTAVKKK